LSLTPAIFLSTVLTHLGGGSVGREGAALQMGGSLGYTAGKWLRLSDEDRRVAVLMGMAAFFTALFGTPLAATVFAIGVASLGLFCHAALLPCLLASLAAMGVSGLLGVAPTRFQVAVPALDAVTLLRVAGLAALCALVSMLFCFCVHQAEHLLGKIIKNPWLRAALGGAALIALTLLAGNMDYNGAGMNIIAAAIEEGRALPWAFALKILFTALSLGAGFKGGEVVPSFFVGGDLRLRDRPAAGHSGGLCRRGRPHRRILRGHQQSHRFLAAGGGDVRRRRPAFLRPGLRPEQPAERLRGPVLQPAGAL